ncbi:MAG: histidine kinase dimerization/phospho-acceptor domain-containing protein, partial [Deltaproteobacteria bacterium]
MTSVSVAARLSRAMIVASSLITLGGLVAGAVAGVGIVIRREDATSLAMARVFQTEIVRHENDRASLLEALRAEVSEQSVFGRQVEVWRGAMRVVAGPRASLLRPPWPEAGSCATQRVDGALWRLCTTSAAGDLRIAIALPMEPLLHRLGSFALAVVVAAVLGTLAFAAVSRRVVRRTLRPFEELQRAVETLDGARKEARVGAVWGLVEADALAKAFDAMLARTEAATARERQFLFDASHELRTPLARMRAHLELARADLPAGSEVASRLAAAETSCASLINVTESI